MIDAHPACALSRRDLLRSGVGATAGLSLASRAIGSDREPTRRVLVVVELAGGNDGLDTVIPHGDDAYHRARPTLRASAASALRLDSHRGLHRALIGLRAAWDEGRLAIVEGCGHPRATRCHFMASAMWHAGSVEPEDARGWLGRLADVTWPEGGAATFVSLGSTLSPALISQRHGAIVLPGSELAACPVRWVGPRPRDERAGAASASALGDHARAAIAGQRSPFDYGSGPLATDLRRVAALLAVGFESRAYYLRTGGFDTHAAQARTRPALLAMLDQGLHAFQRDLRRHGRDGDVTILVFSEFGRRLEENASGGTDHGSAGPVLLLGAGVVPGFHGAPPDLGTLDADGNPFPTTDFRAIYTTLGAQWTGAI